MPQELNDPVLVAFAAGTLLMSLVTCVVLIAARFQGPLLHFEPRRPVPWNAAGGVLACVLVLYVLVAAWENRAAVVPEEGEAAAEQADGDPPPRERTGDEASPTFFLTMFMLQEAVVVGGVLVLVAVYFRASRSDLGLPANQHVLAYDVFIGIVAGMASLAPIHIIQGLLLYLLGKPDAQSGHQLVKMLTDGEPSVSEMLVATIATVVVAPICEEITFRLLLQGALEKWEAMMVGWPCRSVPESASAAVAPSIEQEPTSIEGKPESDDPSGFDVDPTIIDTPPRRGLGGLPFGLLPIVTSAVLFGLAHFGYGPEPVPLFFLALILGYIYHRTHRIVPCIVVHAIFNLFTMVVLWRMVFHGAH